MDPVIGSIIVAVILLAVIILIIHKLESDMKKRMYSCGRSVGCRAHCAECPASSSAPESQTKKSK